MTNQTALAKPYSQFRDILKTDSVQQRFDDLLGARAPAFLSGLLTVVSDDDKLLQCTPKSILAAAARAAIKDLPIDPGLGMAYIVPMRNKKKNGDGNYSYVWEAEEWDGYKGIIQMAYRTQQYVSINADAIWPGEEVTTNRLSGNIEITGEPTSHDNPKGYFAYFKLKNGFEKSLYWPIEKILVHAEHYSESYKYDLKNKTNFTPWSKNRHDMCKKTVLKQLLSKWGLLSIQWQDADNGVPFTGTDPRMMEQSPEIPDFDDVLDGQLKDPEPPADLTEVIISQAVEANLFENEHAAKNALKYCTLQFETVEDGLTWCRAYRGWRNLDAATKKAAEYANNGEMPH